MYLYKNGYIIKSFEENMFYCGHSFYRGIGRYYTWPLDMCTDEKSRQLNDEALSRWFGYTDKRLWVIPSVPFVRRYMEHARNMNRDTFCLMVESTNSTPVITEELPVEKVLGYEYADTDMQTSILWDDINSMDEHQAEQMIAQLNENGLFSSDEKLMHYIQMRERFQKERAEQYFSPVIVRLSMINIESLFT